MPRPPVLKNQIHSLLPTKSVSEIADLLGCTPRYVRGILSEYREKDKINLSLVPKTSRRSRRFPVSDESRFMALIADLGLARSEQLLENIRERAISIL